jgi:hypothetical protein
MKYLVHFNKLIEKKNINNIFCLKKDNKNLCDEKKKNFSKDSIKNSSIKKFVKFFFFLTGMFFEIKQNDKILESFKSRPVEAVEINISELGLVREDILNEKFLFSPYATKKTLIETEIEEIEDDEFRYKNWKNVQMGLAIGGSGIGMWFAYKGLNAWEQWMKEQEQKDIEEEIEMTGTYIDPGAGNVEASIDPLSGKKIIIKQSRDENNNGKNNLKNDDLDKTENE